MMKRLVVVIVIACAVLLAAFGSAHSAPLASGCGVTMPCIGQDEARASSVVRDRGVRLGGRPAACRVFVKGRLIAWCGCWLGVHLGKLDPSLWVARNWARVGSRSAGPCVGCIAVWRGHVGIVTAVDGKRVRVKSGNDGGAVRERWRTTQGVIAWRQI